MKFRNLKNPFCNNYFPQKTLNETIAAIKEVIQRDWDWIREALYLNENDMLYLMSEVLCQLIQQKDVFQIK